MLERKSKKILRERFHGSPKFIPDGRLSLSKISTNTKNFGVYGYGVYLTEKLSTASGYGVSDQDISMRVYEYFLIEPKTKKRYRIESGKTPGLINFKDKLNLGLANKLANLALKLGFIDNEKKMKFLSSSVRSYEWLYEDIKKKDIPNGKKFFQTVREKYDEIGLLGHYVRVGNTSEIVIYDPNDLELKNLYVSNFYRGTDEEMRIYQDLKDKGKVKNLPSSYLSPLKPEDYVNLIKFSEKEIPEIKKLLYRSMMMYYFKKTSLRNIDEYENIKNIREKMNRLIIILNKATITSIKDLNKKYKMQYIAAMLNLYFKIKENDLLSIIEKHIKSKSDKIKSNKNFKIENQLYKIKSKLKQLYDLIKNFMDKWEHVWHYQIKSDKKMLKYLKKNGLKYKEDESFESFDAFLYSDDYVVG